MALQDIKNQIISKIDSMKSLDFPKLYFDGPSMVQWNNLSSEDTKIFITEIMDVLLKLKDNINIVNSVPYDQLTNLNNYLNNIINEYNNTLNNLQLNEITSHHHTTLSYFNNINNLLRSNDLYGEIKLTPNLQETTKKLEEANNQLSLFNKDDFENATKIVADLINKKIEYEDKTIKENLGTFLNRANEHKIYKKPKSFIFGFSGQWWWLFGAVIMGFIVAYIVSSFISVLENDNNISIGTALLRISSLIIPSYFMIFFLNQFTYHKRMYEIYSFKNTSLNIMTDLMKTNQSKTDDILGRGLEVLFTEPQIKEGGKYDKQLVSDMLNILKNQIK